MARVPLGQSAFNRTFGREPEIALKNRFFETNPTNQVDQVGLLSRPGSTFEETFGTGPGRGNFTAENLLGGDLLTVSAQSLFRYDTAGTTTPIIGVIALDATPRFAGVKGAGYQRVFISDGVQLQYYGGQAYQAVLTLTPGAIANDVVQIDDVYYKFSTGSLDTGAPAGTVANPWKVEVGGSAAAAFANLRKAVNASGVPGTDYSTALVEQNLRVGGNANTALSFTARARVAGVPVTPIPVSVIAAGGADGLAWSGAVLAAGPHVLYGVPTPDDVGIVSVAELASYILCLQANSQRVYFIRPGETTIDPLDFFEAESESDDLIELIKVGDQVWLIGTTSTEPWYANGTSDPDENPFSRSEGAAFSRGALEGTVVKLADSIFLVGNDKIAYRIAAGSAEPISTPAIAERIRKAVEAELAQ